MGGSSSKKSKSVETVEEKGGGIVSIHDIPMDEHRRLLIKIVMLMRVDMRELFGMEVANRWGFWVDRYLSKQVRDFADWIPYPKGDHVLEGHKQKEVSAVISDNSHFLFTGSRDGRIKVWNMLDHQIIHGWRPHHNLVRSLAFKRGLLVSGSFDKSIKIWDSLRDYQLVHTLEGHTRFVMSVDINKNASEVVSGAQDNTLRVWSVKTGDCIRVMKSHIEMRPVKFIGNLILCGSYDKSLKVWNSADGTEIQSVSEGIDVRIDGYINDISINCNVSLIACSFDDGFSLFSWAELKYIRKIDIINPHHCAFHPFHPQILAVSNDVGSILIFDLTNDDVIRTLEGHYKPTYDLCFAPIGFRLVSLSRDESVRVWDVSDV